MIRRRGRKTRGDETLCRSGVSDPGYNHPIRTPL